MREFIKVKFDARVGRHRMLSGPARRMNERRTIEDHETKMRDVEVDRNISALIW